MRYFLYWQSLGVKANSTTIARRFQVRIPMRVCECKPSPDVREFLHKIRERNRRFYSDPRGLGVLKDLQQTFPRPWLYVAELLQNAVDEKATRIVVSLQDDGSLVFEHKGATFSPANVESLCMRGVSTKGAGTVGFMGIGFDSVFRSFERAEISSGPWRFALTVANRKGDRFGENHCH